MALLRIGASRIGLPPGNPSLQFENLYRRCFDFRVDSSTSLGSWFARFRREVPTIWIPAKLADVNFRDRRPGDRRDLPAPTSCGGHKHASVDVLRRKLESSTPSPLRPSGPKHDRNNGCHPRPGKRMSHHPSDGKYGQRAPRHPSKDLAWVAGAGGLFRHIALQAPEAIEATLQQRSAGSHAMRRTTKREFDEQ